MSTFVSGTTLSDAWVGAVRALLDAKAPLPNLIISVTNPLDEEPTVRADLDELIRVHRSSGGREVYPVQTVANTIFPEEYFVTPGDAESRTRGYEKYKATQDLRKRTAHSSRRGTYFGRMIDWPGGINQVEHAIQKLSHAERAGQERANKTEIAICDASDCDLRIYDPTKDKVEEGFPCLSHVSISLVEGRLHLTSTYRSQHIDTRAYGNLLGLGRLLRFISEASGLPMGELTNVATCAKLHRPSGMGIRALRGIVMPAEEER